MRAVACIIGCAIIGGCAPASSVPVQPVNIVASDFCRTMKGILPPSGKPSWSIDDTAETRTDARKVGAAVDARCRPAAAKR